MLGPLSIAKTMHVEKAAILAQRFLGLLPGRQLVLGALLLVLPAAGVVTAFGIAPGEVVDRIPRVAVTEAIASPDFAPSSGRSDERFVRQERVLRGDTVAALLARLGANDNRALEFIRGDPVGRRISRQLVPGRSMQAEVGAVGELLVFRYFLGSSSLLEVVRTADGFSASERPIASAPRVFHKSATIRSSLFAATDGAGIPDVVAMQIARVFATDIDFHTDLRKGDRFSVIYEMVYENGELIGPGRILAAEFANQGHEYHAVLFRDDEGRDGWYAPDGTYRAKAFLRSPVEFSRVSSGFGARFHPIFKNWRAHTGVDFAAPRGTRVLAAADGNVVSAGWRNGYGNAVEVKHGGSISTLYGHLSGFAAGVRNGVRVRQGDPIGYVGATGWATGPHLHYEFKISGMHQDPLRVALPKATPVPAHLKAQFDAVAADAASRIALVRTAASARFE
jgi:murein DD-endopeptidase MepM/ murein hydrolase activator NlpD